MAYDDYERQIVGESIDYYGDIWQNHGGEISNHITALLIRRLEKGFKNKDQEAGYREGLVALSQLYASCLGRKKNEATLLKKIDKNKKRTLI